MNDSTIIRDEVIKVLNNLLTDEALFDEYDNKELEVIANYEDNQDEFPFVLWMKDVNKDFPLWDDAMNDLLNNPNTALFFKDIVLDHVDRVEEKEDKEEPWGLFFSLTPAFESIIANKVYKALEEYEKECIGE